MSQQITIKGLMWSQSRVFGTMKRRGFSPFGEFIAFGVDDLSAAEIVAKEDRAQAEYEKIVFSAIVVPSTSK